MSKQAQQYRRVQPSRSDVRAEINARELFDWRQRHAAYPIYPTRSDSVAAPKPRSYYYGGTE